MCVGNSLTTGLSSIPLLRAPSRLFNDLFFQNFHRFTSCRGKKCVKGHSAVVALCKVLHYDPHGQNGAGKFA
jgi:hypothetical protein